MSNEYPQTVAEVLTEMTFRPAALRAVKAFAKSKPWRGTLVERWQKFQQLNTELAGAYGIPVPTLVLSGSGEGDPQLAATVKKLNQEAHVRINVVALIAEPDPQVEAALAQIAKDSGGGYKLLREKDVAKK